MLSYGNIRQELSFTESKYVFFFFTIYNNTSKNIKLDPIYTMIYYNGLKLGLDLTNAFPHIVFKNEFKLRT